MGRARVWVLAATLVVLAGPGRSDVVGRGAQVDPVSEDGALELRLGNGDDAGERLPRASVAPAQALSVRDVLRVLDRMPVLPPLEGEQKEFALRESSLPPPRTGVTVKETFPPPQTAPRPELPEAGALTVSRHAPDGEVPLAPQLSLTFSQPMVAVTSHGDLAQQDVPVRVTPQPPGRWRWVGTKTLLFEPELRFPMATQYEVFIPEGTRSAVGGALADNEGWRFGTPPPQLEARHPVDQPTVRQPLLFASFDQRIDPAAMLASIQVTPGNVGLRLATPEEVKADTTVSQLAAQALEGRWLAFMPVAPLPVDAAVSVAIAAGAPSAEGPRKTVRAQLWKFRTFGALKVTDHRCGYDGSCRPGWPWDVVLSNPIDARAFQRDWVRVTPDVPSLRTAVYGNNLQIEGLTKGQTTYTVTLAAALRDEFGQTLGKDQALTFKVGTAEPMLGGEQGLIVLDPRGQPRFSVYSIQRRALKVRAYAVGPNDWSRFTTYAQERWGSPNATPPGKLVLSETIAVQGASDELTETQIDLGKAFPNGVGHALLLVEPSNPTSKDDRESILAWLQATKIGLDAFVDDQRLIAWTTSLANGKPLADCAVTIDAGSAARSDADGVARLDLDTGGGRLLIARCGNDVAILPESSYWDSSVAWMRTPRTDGYAWYVFDDRQMYRPGEEVKLKGWIRQVGAGPTGDVGPLASRPKTLSYAVRDAQGNEIAKGSAELNAFAGFELSVALPATMNLGTAYVMLETPISTYAHTFQVQEFRRPEFEVNASASAGPHLVGTRADASVSAAYYAGGALPDAPVRWTVTQSRGSYTPPNRDDFTFGIWKPWWNDWRPVQERESSKVDTFEARTDSAGRHVLRMDLVSVDPPLPTSLTAQATVTDVNRQAWTASTNLLVHPSELYVGLRSPRIFVQRGEKLEVDAIVTDIDGKAVGGRPFSVRAERLDWQQVEGEWKELAVDAQDCAITSASEAVRCTFVGREGGAWRITAEVQDDRQRRNRSQFRLWVAGGKVPPSRDVTQEKVELIPDRKEYRAGETAELLVLAPFADAEGILTLRRSGLIRHERFRVSGASHTLRVPIEAGWTPNVHVDIDLVGQAPRLRDDGTPDAALPPRPAFAGGSLDLSIPPLSRTLALKVTPRDKELEPGGKTELEIELADAAGKPVANAELAVVVVDEAVLALTGYRLADPIATFYARRESGVRDVHLRSLVKLTRPESLLEEVRNLESGGAAAGVAFDRMVAPAPQMSMRMQDMAQEKSLVGGSGAPEIRIRSDFAALALFAGSVPTDSRGRAKIPVKVPDSLTRYRVMVVGVTAGNQFGKGESTLTARLPLMVRPSAPRFLNFGDRFELPVVVQNQTDAELKVNVAVRASNLELTDGAGRSIRVPARDRVEVRFPAAARRAGTARFQVGGVSGRFADAAAVSLPVWTPATTEAFATYGQLDQGAVAQPVAAPGEVVREFGGLELTTSSTALQALTDAVLYLVAYPFECSEQLASRVLAIAALKDVLAAFEADGLPAPAALVGRVESDLKQLEKLQNDDGGFAFWRRGDESWPYISIHVAHALERARMKGFSVPEPMWTRARTHLENIERYIPKEYGVEPRRVLRAYALYVLQRMGQRNPAKARAILAEAGVEKTPLEALGWLLPVLSGDAGSASQVDAIRRQLANRATETAATASFAVNYGEQGPHLLLHSNSRTDAVLLEALIGDQPKSDLIPKLVEGLLAQRRRGRWDSTQENAFVLLALDRYFATYEKLAPDFVARAWLGEQLASEQAFRGRSTERRHVDVPMQVVAELGSAPLVIAKDGPGRLYYRIGLRYAPASLKLEPSDQGFAVERSYEAVDDPADVRRDVDGTWHIRAGARVRVRLSMAAESRRYHVALVDPIPAGLEPLNPALAVTGALPPGDPQTGDVIDAPGLGGPRGSGSWWWWRQVWYEHQNLRDERVEAFTSLLWEGVYTYRYFALATTPGTFIVPPTKAEEMYHPETFGRTATDRVIVE